MEAFMEEASVICHDSVSDPDIAVHFEHEPQVSRQAEIRAAGNVRNQVVFSLRTISLLS